MRLLIFTQKVDKSDSVLGFFHGWLVEFAKNAESVIVVCLEKGEVHLPENVTVYSLGKEGGVSKFGYIKNLYRYLSLVSGSYDKVFVHMNEEYVLLAGLYWKIKNIPVYLWRNHPNGTLLTRIAVFLSTKVFCTSKQSFTARFKKTTIMPAGIDTNVFRPANGLIRKKYSVCMVGRISRIKHIEVALEAIKILVSSGAQITLHIVGGVSEKDRDYYNKLKENVAKNGLETSVLFSDAVTQDKLPEIYSSYEVCLNLTESGSFDKTIVESASCGAVPLVSNSSLNAMLPSQCLTTLDPEEVAKSLQGILDAHERVEIQKELTTFVKSQSLSLFMEKLITEM